MNKLLEEHGEAIVATVFVAFALGYGLNTCEFNSFVSGFAAGAAALTAAVMWLD